ncbi:putative 2-aminoethylphosphonate ABC transporter ATP-binding protein [Chelatococcus sp. SYSU_G07232]|uniref:2-aminoethylphosphonate ABC transporter ATP-binding protein n=2 Tax=Chelatococcus albus TaxID=3047466 RepID=A0ABT7AL24_9HYPH|nr:putative 2-aminoethylphosphonate ABC transporter ATP-binding protein [Chelatococcus sp. SYSU_G07232]MDJ1160058.1 putative 2-aminoethylphosphonate ABC transporter ATP-binding protein [Chelatococcus sp. SYSU_G07232]
MATPPGDGVSSLPCLSIRGLGKHFGAFTALKAIDLDVRRGEFICFLGPSGCGKTTLLRAIAGLDRQDEGTIAMSGRDVSDAPPATRDFGIVFQSYALFPNLTVADNVAYGLVNRRRPRAEIKARVAELLALVGLPDQGHKFPVQLSGGQQQRVALARALATSPGLLLLDEPLSALDAKVRVRLREEIRSLQRRLGVTTIMVTHDQEEALAMADRIVVMNQGVIEQVGTPADIYRHPATAFVADFVGTTSFLDATVTGPGRVVSGALELACADDRGLAPGTPVLLGLRPEEIRLRGVGAGDVNAVAVRVEGLDFLGSFCRARLQPEIAAAGTLRADLSANLMRDLAVAEGQTIMVVLPPESLRVFAARG